MSIESKFKTITEEERKKLLNSLVAYLINNRE